MKKIDARGLSCPAPVLQAKAAIEEPGGESVNIMVDNEASCQNVCRFLESKGYQVSIEKKEADISEIIGHLASPSTDRSDESTDKAPEALSMKEKGRKILVMCATDRIGFGDDELGLKLMISFIKTLKEMGPDLWRLVFVNNGVKLTVAGSPLLSELKEYEASGLKILVCGTCLTHFDILAEKQVGDTTNMLDIVTAIQVADKVINI